MDKRDILSKLSCTCLKLGIDRSEVTIVGGSASLLNKMRDETNDIDIIIGRDTYDKLLTKPNIVITSLPPIGHFKTSSVIQVDGLDFVHIDSLRPYQTYTRRGFKVLSKLGLLMYRIDLGTEKDLEDILQLRDLWSVLDLHYAVKLKFLLE